MTDPDWKDTLSFSDRFSVHTTTGAVVLIPSFAICRATALTSSNAGYDYGLAVTEAQKVETDIYGKAASEDEYTCLWSSHLSSIGVPSDLSGTTPTVTQSLNLSSRISQSIDNGEDDTLTAPVRIGPYFTSTIHSEGISSTVYRALALDSLADKPSYVALKVTTPSVLHPPHNPDTESSILKFLQSPNPHPNILSLLDTFTTPSSTTSLTYFVLVFPFLPYEFGTLLRQGKMAPSTIKSTLKEITSALSFLHSHFIIHRDLKPSNILLSSPIGPSFLIDFGIAWSPSLSTEPPQKKITSVCTTSYRPIEILFGYRDYGTSLDIWSLGCVLAETFSSPPHEPFFDSGELGSELKLISSIFQKLGTPEDSTCLGIKKFPDWGKIGFVKYERKEWRELLPSPWANEEVRSLVDRMLAYDPDERIKAEEALKHPFYNGVEVKARGRKGDQ